VLTSVVKWSEVQLGEV